MTGFDSADRFRVKMLQDVGQITGVILLEPEKMASYAQSGKALTVLCQPFVDLVEELVPCFQSSIKKCHFENDKPNDTGAYARVALHYDDSTRLFAQDNGFRV